MLKNKLLSIVCAVSVVATMFGSISVFATDKSDIEAADVKVRYEYDAPNGYKNGESIGVKMYVDGIPTMDLYNPGGKGGKWNGTALSQYSVTVTPTVFEKCEVMDAGCGYTDGTQVNYVDASDEYRIVMAQTAVANYWIDEDINIADPYFASFQIDLKADLTEKVEIPVTTMIVFQSFVNSASQQTVKTITTPIILGESAPVLADFTDLNAAIADYDAVKDNADKYTEETWSAATTAYDAAKAINQTTETDQDKVNAAATALNDAITGLQLKPVVEDKVTVIPDVPMVKDNGSNLTFGIGGVVEITGNKSFTKLVFALEDASNSKSGSYTWDFGAPISATVTYGLNITGCPVNSNITATVTAQ